MTTLIFTLLCGVLYIIGLIFGLTYQEVSVYICVYAVPVICTLSVFVINLVLLHKLVLSKNRFLTCVLLFISFIHLMLYIANTEVLFDIYNQPVDLCFNVVMTSLRDIAKNSGTTYEFVNLLIYCIIFPLIVGFNLFKAWFINKLYKKHVALD